MHVFCVKHVCCLVYPDCCWLVAYLCVRVLCEACLLFCVTGLLFSWLHIFLYVFYAHMPVVLGNRIVVWLVAYLCACVLCEACPLSCVTGLLFGWLHIFVHVFCLRHVYCLM